MGKNLKIGERIESLRRARKMNQTRLAEYLGVSQPAISAWEANERQPSADIFVKLGNLAPYPDCMWYWKEAGIDQQAMLSGAEKLLKERGALPLEGEIIRIPCVRMTPQGTKALGTLFPFPGELSANPGSTICLIVDENSAGPWLPRGDLLVLDTSQSNAKNLCPFWDQVVLIDAGIQHGKSISVEWTEGRWWGPRNGLCMGRLRYRQLDRRFEDPFIPLGFHHLVWAASFAPFGDFEMESQAGIKEFDIGHWEHPSSAMPATAEEIAALEVEVRKEAPSQIRLAARYRILGVVIGWFRPLKGEK